MNLYEQLGQDTIRDAIETFYERAFNDPIIGHFFFNLDHSTLVAKQIEFTMALLGAGTPYRGKPLRAAHARIPLLDTHFRRRQVLMAEVLDEMAVPVNLAQAWLAKEEALRPQIVHR